MRLEDLYENFGTASPEAQALYIASYRLLRAKDMEKPAKSFRKKPSSSTPAKPKLTEKEKAVAKLLGIKQKDIIALRESIDDDTDDTVLLDDDYDEE
ncbi:hypothetical protein KO465_04835 [Candidatus Micrarchaeota archaeon]|jgi:hypothetical protein|nr:hypothetical protein [Candidatus Micrarchaeota archaeon]